MKNPGEATMEFGRLLKSLGREKASMVALARAQAESAMANRKIVAATIFRTVYDKLKEEFQNFEDCAEESWRISGVIEDLAMKDLEKMTIKQVSDLELLMEGLNQ